MKRNSNLQEAKRKKNDEFYTQISDIEKELKYYRKHFEDKKVFLNCDDPEKSDFWKYFYLNFNELKLNKLIATHFEIDKPSYKLEYDGKEVNKINLKQNGDFRSDECIEILKESDIVVTNPPFSLFREFIDLLMKYNKKFLVIGNNNAITYKNIFKYIKENKLWLGNNSVREFIQPDGSKKKFGNICWFTNLDYEKRYEIIETGIDYNKNKDKYLEYYDYKGVINIDKINMIPDNYNGIMGVPITFLSKYNPNQFEILSCHEPCIEIKKLLKNPKFKEYKSRQKEIDGILCQKTYHRYFVRKINFELTNF